MKVFVVIDINNASTEDIYCKTDLFIASTHDIAKKYARRCDLEENNIVEVVIDEEELSLTGTVVKIDPPLNRVESPNPTEIPLADSTPVVKAVHFQETTTSDTGSLKN